MRNSVLRRSPFARISVFALVALSLSVALVGCGGGSGTSPVVPPVSGGNGPPAGQNPTLAFVNGRVVDNSSSATGVPNATVTVIGTTITAKTATDGSFTLPNVPIASTQFSVTSPDPSTWYNNAVYLGKQYDTINCTLPLPANLVTGRNDLPANIVLSLGGANPPPPPQPGGCSN